MNNLTSGSLTEDQLLQFGQNFTGEGYAPGSLGTLPNMQDIINNPSAFANYDFSGAFAPGSLGTGGNNGFLGSAFGSIGDWGPFALGGASLLLQNNQNNKNNRRADKALNSNLEQVARRNAAIDSWA
jgi:hypothetical protein